MTNEALARKTADRIGNTALEDREEWYRIILSALNEAVKEKDGQLKRASRMVSETYMSNYDRLKLKEALATESRPTKIKE